jgi:hypothetical protein
LPDESFGALARRQIPQFEAPSLLCVDQVHKELRKILAKRMKEHQVHFGLYLYSKGKIKKTIKK